MWCLFTKYSEEGVAAPLRRRVFGKRCCMWGKYRIRYGRPVVSRKKRCGESIESDREDPRPHIITISLYRRRSIHWRRSINRGRAGLQLRGDLRNFGHQLPCGKSIFPDFVLGLRIGPDLLDNRGYRDLGLTIGTIVIKDRICCWWRTGRRGRQEIDDFRNLAPRPP